MTDLNVNKEDVLDAIEHIKSENQELSWLEASCQWLEENAYNESAYLKVLPEMIIERIKAETIESKMLRPSMIELNSNSTLDFLL